MEAPNQIYSNFSINCWWTSVRACCQNRRGGGWESKLCKMLSVDLIFHQDWIWMCNSAPAGLNMWTAFQWKDLTALLSACDPSCHQHMLSISIAAGDNVSVERICLQNDQLVFFSLCFFWDIHTGSSSSSSSPLAIHCPRWVRPLCSPQHSFCTYFGFKTRPGSRAQGRVLSLSLTHFSSSLSLNLESCQIEVLPLMHLERHVIFTFKFRSKALTMSWAALSGFPRLCLGF